MKKTLSRFAAGTAAFGLSLLIYSCSFYFVPSVPAPEILLRESFGGFNDSGNIGDQWDVGTLTGEEPLAENLNGHLDIRGPQHFLTTRESYRNNLTVLVDWAVLKGNAESEYPSANETNPDFAIVHVTSGTRVELYLYQKLDTSEREDRLIIRSGDGVELASTVVPSAGRTTGLIEVRLFPSSAGLTVVSNVPDLGLVAETTAPPVDGNNSQITIEVSGLPNDPRALDEVLLIRERIDLGALL